MANSKYRYLFKNVGILTISNFGSKILSFVLVPLYTSILSTEDYGTYDLYNTTTALVIPILTLNILDAVLRFFLDKEQDPKKVFSIGIKMSLKAAIIFYILVALNYHFNIISSFAEYPIFLCVYMTCYMFYDVINQLARGMDKIMDIGIAGLINSIVMLSLNIYFLKFLGLGIQGYFLASCIAYVVPFLYIFIKLKAWKYISFKKTDKALKKEMVTYSKPMVFNTIAWWINNASDRYIVTFISGVAANGIYSVAYKIPSILNIVQNIFSQAWTLSAVKEFDSDNAPFFRNIYNIYNTGLVITCSALIVGDKLIAKILFANEFYVAWKYAPWLMISVVFGSLSGFFGGIFTANKDTKIIAKTTVAGAAINTALNFLLVYAMGPAGAAIATMVSYIIVWAVRFVQSKKIIDMGINLTKDILAYAVLIIQSALLLLIDGYAVYVFEILLFAVLAFMYYKTAVVIAKKLIDTVQNRFIDGSKKQGD